MKIDINHLSSMTRKAIADGEAEARLKAERAKQKAEAKKREQEAKAEGILLQVPTRAETEAKAGRNHALVMSVGYDEFVRDNNPGHRRRSGAELIDVPRLVWDKLVEAGLNPTLEEWDDGVGMTGGYNIVIHWPKD